MTDILSVLSDRQNIPTPSDRLIYVVDTFGLPISDRHDRAEPPS